MTLEQEILDAIQGCNTPKRQAERVVKIALDLAREAYYQGVRDQCNYAHGGGNSTFNQFIQDYVGE